ncbi:MAG: polysaccharide deacetylase family protein [Clostridia bacterium]|nr:polysaccharide deacetylase family protein [Clostridia bacterium]
MYCTFIKKKTLIITLSLFLVAVLSLIVLSGSGTYAVFYGGNLRKLPIYYVKTGEKKVALTFDCAWGTDYTDKLLEIMENEKVVSTFFTVEFWARKYPDYLKKIDEKGHEIGTHSSTHPYMSKLGKGAIEKELTTSCDAIESVINKKVKVFRAPYGDYDDLLIDTAKELDLFTIQWDVDSLDWKNLTSAEIQKRVLNKVKNGSIVLFHNQGLHTAEALLPIIKELKSRGFEFTTVSQLIYKDNYQMSVDGGQEKCN